MQVVCLESGKAHVVAAGAPVAGRAGGAGHAYFVGSLSDPVTPTRQKTCTVSMELGTTIELFRIQFELESAFLSKNA